MDSHEERATEKEIDSENQEQKIEKLETKIRKLLKKEESQDQDIMKLKLEIENLISKNQVL